MLILAVLGAILGAALVGAPAAAAEALGTPTVIDGETLEVAGRRFRLYGIDAPELAQSCELRGRRYPCGRVVRTALMDLVAGVEVRCVPRATEAAPDTGAAVVASCFAGGYDLARGMVHTGWALAMPRAGTGYARIERAAEKARRGLWKGTFVKPWQWRR